ncbi:hypothetical protein FRC04_005030 [Tulasnella sp. 424]|nr:hypothetical protein FRC04_005030 [Tulasnella sp. 424]
MNRQSNANRETEGSLPVSTPQSATAAVPGAPGGDKFAELKNAIVNLIKNTAWTGNSSEAQQRLLKTVNNLANPANNSAQVSGEYKVLVEEIIKYEYLSTLDGAFGEASREPASWSMSGQS